MTGHGDACSRVAPDGGDNRGALAEIDRQIAALRRPRRWPTRMLNALSAIGVLAIGSGLWTALFLAAAYAIIHLGGV